MRRTCLRLQSSPRSELTLNFLKRHKAHLSAERELLLSEIRPLRGIQQRIEKKVLRRADFAAFGGFTYLCAQTSLLFFWVYIKFDWNLVEPITYLLSFSVTWLSILIFFSTGKEFSYNAVRDMFLDRVQRRLYKEDSFDVHRYNKLEAELRDVEKQLQDLEKV